MRKMTQGHQTFNSFNDERKEEDWQLLGGYEEKMLHRSLFDDSLIKFIVNSETRDMIDATKYSLDSPFRC